MSLSTPFHLSPGVQRDRGLLSLKVTADGPTGEADLVNAAYALSPLAVRIALCLELKPIQTIYVLVPEEESYISLLLRSLALLCRWSTSRRKMKLASGVRD